MLESELKGWAEPGCSCHFLDADREADKKDPQRGGWDSQRSRGETMWPQREREQLGNFSEIFE